MSTITLPNGIVLDPDDDMARTLQNRAMSRGLTDVQIYLAIHQNDYRAYILCVDGKAEYEHESSEAIWAWIDMLWLDRSRPK